VLPSVALGSHACLHRAAKTTDRVQVDYLTHQTLPRFVRSNTRALLCFTNRLEPHADLYASRLAVAAAGAAIACGVLEVRHYPDIAADFGVVGAPVTAVLVQQRLAFLEFGAFDDVGVAALIEAVLSHPTG